ncbi:MAG: flagellar hook-associated protein FlgL [Thermodesulfobacteriota bacterium]
MAMKVTMGMNYRKLSAGLEDISSKMADLRQQAATGKKMSKPSDDPGAIRPLLNYKLASSSTDRYIKQVEATQGDMNVLDGHLDHLENIMVKAKEMNIAAMSDSANAEDRKTYADQVGQMFDEALQVANTQLNGQYIFSGYKESTQPFTENTSYDPDAYDSDNAATRPVAYHGDENVRAVEISPGKQIETGLSGNALFLGDADNNGQRDPGGVDLFATLKNLEDAMRNNDEAKISEGLGQLENGADQVRRLRGNMGNTAWRIERAGEHLSEASNEFKKSISGYEDADIVEVFSRLLQNETAFEAALNVTSRVSRLSILDFM